MSPWTEPGGAVIHERSLWRWWDNTEQMGTLALTELYLLLDAIDLRSQPLDHPVHLRDLLLGVSQVVAMPTSCQLQLFILVRADTGSLVKLL